LPRSATLCSNVTHRPNRNPSLKRIFAAKELAHTNLRAASRIEPEWLVHRRFGFFTYLCSARKALEVSAARPPSFTAMITTQHSENQHVADADHSNVKFSRLPSCETPSTRHEPFTMSQRSCQRCQRNALMHSTTKARQPDSVDTNQEPIEDSDITLVARRRFLRRDKQAISLLLRICFKRNCTRRRRQPQVCATSITHPHSRGHKDRI
jgi:hypothetical protein